MPRKGDPDGQDHQGKEACGLKLDFKNKRAWAKFPNSNEYEVVWDTKIVGDAIVYGKELTKEEYLNYKASD